MNKDELIARIKKRYPDGANLTVAGLAKLVETVWGVAYSNGVANGRALEAMEREAKEKASSIFRDIFK